MTTSKTESDESKRQTGSYPYLPLGSALRISDAIKELGGARSDIPKSALAKHLGEAEKSPTFSQRITAAKSFGLINGRNEYALTEIAKRYYFPTSDFDKSAALLEIFSSPASFSELLRRFDGDRLPSREILGNILHRELNVPESWRDRVAGFFVSSAQFVGAIDSQGFLRHRASFHRKTTSEPNKAQDVAFIKQSLSDSLKLHNSGESGNVNAWNFSHNGKIVRLETPTDLDKALWEKLNAYVQLLKPIGIDMN